MAVNGLVPPLPREVMVALVETAPRQQLPRDLLIQIDADGDHHRPPPIGWAV